METVWPAMQLGPPEYGGANIDIEVENAIICNVQHDRMQIPGDDCRSIICGFQSETRSRQQSVMPSRSGCDSQQSRMACVWELGQGFIGQGCRELAWIMQSAHDCCGWDQGCWHCVRSIVRSVSCFWPTASTGLSLRFCCTGRKPLNAPKFKTSYRL